MNLSWDPLDDESEPVAVARPQVEDGGKAKEHHGNSVSGGPTSTHAIEKKDKPPSTYKLVYITPDETGPQAHSYVDATGRHAEAMAAFGASKLTLPPQWLFEPLPAAPPLDSKETPRRDIYLVTGPSGSGKSHWVRMYVRNYMRLYPKHSVFLISSLKEDSTLDAVANIKRIDVEKLLAAPPKDVKTWANSLVIIDDVEGLDAAKANVVQQLQDMIASEGRHSGTCLIRASHLSTDYKRTRLLLQECHGFVLFPKAGAHSQYMYLLTKYGGLDKKIAAHLLSLPSRWMLIRHTQPRYVLTQNTVFLLA